MAGGVSALICAAGCADDGVSLHAICPIFPELDEDQCTYDPEGGDCLTEGVVNLASATSYRLYLRVESGLTARARQIPPQGEPNGMQITGAEIELRDASGARLLFKNVTRGNESIPVPNPYDVVASGYIAPSAVGVVVLPAVDTDHLNQFLSASGPVLSQIVVSVKLKGRTSGGSAVEGGEFTWPLRLISVDPRAGNGCRDIGYCSDSFGQDQFAEACRVVR